MYDSNWDVFLHIMSISNKFHRVASDTGNYLGFTLLQGKLICKAALCTYRFIYACIQYVSPTWQLLDLIHPCINFQILSMCIEVIARAQDTLLAWLEEQTVDVIVNNGLINQRKGTCPVLGFSFNLAHMCVHVSINWWLVICRSYIYQSLVVESLKALFALYLASTFFRFGQLLCFSYDITGLPMAGVHRCFCQW